MTDKIHIVYCDDDFGIRQYVHNIDDLYSIEFKPYIEGAMYLDYNSASYIRLLLVGRNYKNANSRVDRNATREILRSLLYGENSL